MSYRVVLWTTGHVASYAGKAIVEHPNMELVGAYAWSPEKAGQRRRRADRYRPPRCHRDQRRGRDPGPPSRRGRVLPDHADRGHPRAHRHDLPVPRSRDQRRQHGQPDHRSLVGRRGAVRRVGTEGQRVAVRQRREPRVREPADAHRDGRVQRGAEALGVGRGGVLGLRLTRAVGDGGIRPRPRRSPTSTSTSTRAPPCSRTRCR